MRILICLLVIFCLAGCVTEPGWYDAETNTVLSQGEYDKLTVEEQKSFEPAMIERIRPGVEAGVKIGRAHV